MDKIRIAKRIVGEGEPTFIIAEIGSNHDGSLNQAKRLIQAAKEAGADAVKFQSFKADLLVSRKKLPHVHRVVNQNALPEDWYQELVLYARKKGIIFLSTPFDIERANLLQEIGVDAFKIASGDLTFYPLLKHVARFKKPVILSTGMAFLEEVKKAVDTVRREGNNEIILLQCVSCYPAKLEDANIKAMVTMRNFFDLPVGYSDHTPGEVVPLGAVALGASVIEKHLTLSRNLKGPDHSFALEVNEFGEMVKKIRQLEKALGSGEKRPVAGEMEERKFARRGVYASCYIPKGTVLKEKMIKMVRPAYRDSFKNPEEIVGKVARVDILEDEPVTIQKICDEVLVK